MGYVKSGAEFGDGDGGVTDRLNHADRLVAQRRLELRLTRRHDAYAVEARGQTRGVVLHAAEELEAQVREEVVVPEVQVGERHRLLIVTPLPHAHLAVRLVVHPALVHTALVRHERLEALLQRGRHERQQRGVEQEGTGMGEGRQLRVHGGRVRAHLALLQAQRGPEGDGRGGGVRGGQRLHLRLRDEKGGMPPRGWI